MRDNDEAMSLIIDKWRLEKNRRKETGLKKVKDLQSECSKKKDFTLNIIRRCSETHFASHLNLEDKKHKLKNYVCLGSWDLM